MSNALIALSFRAPVLAQRALARLFSQFVNAPLIRRFESHRQNRFGRLSLSEGSSGPLTRLRISASTMLMVGIYQERLSLPTTLSGSTGRTARFLYDRIPLHKLNDDRCLVRCSYFENLFNPNFGFRRLCRSTQILIDAPRMSYKK